MPVAARILFSHYNELMIKIKFLCKNSIHSASYLVKRFYQPCNQEINVLNLWFVYKNIDAKDINVNKYVYVGKSG